MGKKRKEMEEYLNYFFLMVVLQSLLVPYDGILNKPKPSVKTPSLTDYRLNNILETLYPSEGLDVYVLTDLLPNHSPSPAQLSPRLPANPRAVPQNGVWPPYAPLNTPQPSDLSLEEYDLIDVLWRQDIDMEKGRYEGVNPPERQHEHDSDLIAQKHLSHQMEFSDENAVGHYPTPPYPGSTKTIQLHEDPSKGLSEEWLMAKPKNDFDFMPTNNNDNNNNNNQEKSTFEMYDEAKTTDPTTPTATSTTENGHKERVDAQVEDWLKRSRENQAEQEQIEREELELDRNMEAFLEMLESNETTDIQPVNDILLSTLQTPSESNETEVIRDPLSIIVEAEDGTTLPTPSLDLSPADANLLFTDHQVNADIVDSVSALSSAGDTGSLAESAGGVGSAGGSGMWDIESNTIISPPLRLQQRPAATTEYHQLQPAITSSRHRSAYSASSDLNMWMEMEAFGGSGSGGVGGGSIVGSVGSSVSSSSGKYQNQGLVVVPNNNNENINGAEGSGVGSPPSSSSYDHDYVYSPQPSTSAAAEDIIQPSSSSASSSTAAADMQHQWRHHGKLVPQVPKQEPIEFDDQQQQDESSSSSKTDVDKKPRFGRKSQDEKMASDHNLPYSPQEIVSMPLHLFQALMRDASLTPAQLDAIKKIRRRGKNKVAARNCRKRKTASMDTLETEISLLEYERDQLSQKNTHLKETIEKEQAEITALEEELYGQ